MRSEYSEKVLQIVLERLKFLDEAGSNLAMTRLYGRAKAGQRVVETVPQNYGENVSMAAAISMAGVSAPMTRCGSGGWIGFSRICQRSLVSDFGGRRCGGDG
jgi:hypothetical protein